MFGIFRGTGMMGKHSARRSQSGYMVAAALASVALIAAATTVMLSSATTASKTAKSVSAKAKLSGDLSSAFAYLSNTGVLGGNGNSGITNMFYAPPAVRSDDAATADMPDFMGMVPQMNTVDPNGKPVGYVVFYNGPESNSEAVYSSLSQQRTGNMRPVQPVYVNTSINNAIGGNNMPAIAFIAPGANGRIDIKNESTLKALMLTQDSSGNEILRSNAEIANALGDQGIDDRIYGYGMQLARDTQGETTSNLVQTDTTCPEETHKLVYRPREGGGTEFVCVREQDPNIVYNDAGVTAPMVVSSVVRTPAANDAVVRTLNFVSLASQLGGMITGGSGITVNSSSTGVQISINRSDSGLFPAGACAADQRVTWNGNNFSCAVTSTGGGNPTGITSVAFRYLANPSPAGSGDVVANVENNNTLLFRRIRSADANLLVQTTPNEIVIRNTAPATNIQGRNIGGAPCGGGNVRPQAAGGGSGKGGSLATAADPAGGAVTQLNTLQTAADPLDSVGNSGPCDFQEVYAGKADAMTLMFRRLEGGPGVVLSDGKVDANGYPSIKITSDPAAAGALVDVRNVGNGVPLARKNGGVVEVKSLRGTGGTLIRTVGDVVEIEAPGGITAGDVNTQIANYLGANVFPAASCPQGQVLTYSASNTPRLLCVSAGGFWALNAANEIVNNNPTTNVRLANNGVLTSTFGNRDLFLSGNGMNLRESTGRSVDIQAASGVMFAASGGSGNAQFTRDLMNFISPNAGGIVSNSTLASSGLALTTSGASGGSLSATGRSLILSDGSRTLDMQVMGGINFTPNSGNDSSAQFTRQQMRFTSSPETSSGYRWYSILNPRGLEFSTENPLAPGSLSFDNTGIKMWTTPGNGGRELFSLSYSPTSNGGNAQMRLNNRPILGMPDTECTAAQVLTFRNGALACVDGGAGGGQIEVRTVTLPNNTSTNFTFGFVPDVVIVGARSPSEGTGGSISFRQLGSGTSNTDHTIGGRDNNWAQISGRLVGNTLTIGTWSMSGTVVLTALKSGNTGAGGSLPTCTAGQTLIANSSGTLECANMPTATGGAGGGSRIAAAPIAGTALSAVSTSGSNQTRNGAINSQAAVIKADLLCSGSDNGVGGRSAGVTRLVFKNASNTTISDVNLCAMVTNDHGGGQSVAGVPAGWGNTPYGTSTNRSVFTEYVPIPEGAANVEITAYNDATIEISQFAYANSGSGGTGGTGGSTQVFYTCQPTFALAGGATGAENQAGNPCFEARKGIQVQTRYLPIACHNNADNRIAGGTMKWGTGFGASGNPSGATSFWTSDNAGGTDASACIGNVIVADTQATGGGGTGGGATGFTLAHLGSGITLASQTAGNTSALSLKTLRQGAGISITESNGEITIANTGSGGGTAFSGTTLNNTTAIPSMNTTLLRTNFPADASKILIEGTCTAQSADWGTPPGSVIVTFRSGTTNLYSVTICNATLAVPLSGNTSQVVMAAGQVLDLPTGADRIIITMTSANGTYRFLK